MEKQHLGETDRAFYARCERNSRNDGQVFLVATKSGWLTRSGRVTTDPQFEMPASFSTVEAARKFADGCNKRWSKTVIDATEGF